MKVSSIEKKIVYELTAIYDAENRFLDAQQQMVEQSVNKQLKSMFQNHVSETQQQIQNLEQVFSLMSQTPQRNTSETAAGLIKDGQKLIKEASENPGVLEVALADIQAKIENFEIACYRSLIASVQFLKQKEIVALLQQNLRQEEQTAQLLEKQLPRLIEEAAAVASN